MQGSCLLDDFPLPSPVSFDAAPDDSAHPLNAPPLLHFPLPDLPPELTGLHRVDEDDDAGSSSGAGGNSKNDRSLGLLCQKFIMLLLVLPVRGRGCLCLRVKHAAVPIKSTRIPFNEYFPLHIHGSAGVHVRNIMLIHLSWGA